MLIRSLVFVLLLLFSSPLLSSGRLAVADVERIMNTSEAVKFLNKELESAKVKLQEKLGKVEASLKKKDKELASQRDILSSDAFQKKAVEFQERVLREQSDAQAQTSALEKSYVKAMKKINEKVLDVVRVISRHDDFDMVVPTSHILFYSEEVPDVSSKVVKALNKELPIVKMDYAL